MSEPVYASVARRIAAYLLDGVFASVVVLVLALVPVLLTGQPAAGLVGYAALLMLSIVQWCLLGTKGYTLGQLTLGIRVVDVETGDPIGMGRALLRYLVLSLCGSIVVLLAVVVALLARDPRRQGWHDKAARSVVVEAAPRPAGVLPTAPPPAPPTAPPPAPPTARPTARPTAPPPVPPPAAPAVRTTAPPSTPALALGDLVAPPPGRPTPAPVSARPRWVLHPGAGEALEVTGTVVVGRDPDATVLEGATRWSVDDPELTVSKTHGAFSIVGESLWVEDLDSTHGVVIRRNGDEATLDPRRSTRLLDGDVVVLGVFEVRVESTS